jgi:hypothetical protein
MESRQAGLAWHAPNLAAAGTLALTSPDFDDGGAIPGVHAAERAGGANLRTARRSSCWSSRTPTHPRRGRSSTASRCSPPR